MYMPSSPVRNSPAARTRRPGAGSAARVAGSVPEREGPSARPSRRCSPASNCRRLFAFWPLQDDDEEARLVVEGFPPGLAVLLPEARRDGELVAVEAVN